MHHRSRECRRINPVRCQRTTTRGINIAETNVVEKENRAASTENGRTARSRSSIRELRYACVFDAFRELACANQRREINSTAEISTIDLEKGRCDDNSRIVARFLSLSRLPRENISGACSLTVASILSQIMPARHNTRINNH